MESLSSTHADSYWSMDQQDLVPTRAAFTIPRTKAKTSDYETGLSAAEYDEDEEQLNVAGRVKKVSSRSACGNIVFNAIFMCIYAVDNYSVNNLLCVSFQFSDIQKEFFRC